MEKTIAHLEIRISDVEDGSVTSKLSEGNYLITIHISDMASTRKMPKFFQTTLAHELGHFLADITHEKAQEITIFDSMFNPAAFIPAEKQAWELGHVINPDLNTKIENADMRTYEKAAQ